MKPKIFLLAGLLATLAATPAMVQQPVEKGGEDETGPYEVVENWPVPLASQFPDHEAWTWGLMAGIFGESPNRVFLLQRGELPAKTADGRPAAPQAIFSRPDARQEHFVLVADATGKIVESWPQYRLDVRHAAQGADQPVRSGETHLDHR